MLQLGSKFGVFRPSFLLGHFQETGIATLFCIKPRHVKKFGECWLMDLGKTELAKIRNMRKT